MSIFLKRPRATLSAPLALRTVPIVVGQCSLATTRRNVPKNDWECKLDLVNQNLGCWLLVGHWWVVGTWDGRLVVRVLCLGSGKNCRAFWDGEAARSPGGPGMLATLDERNGSWESLMCPDCRPCSNSKDSTSYFDCACPISDAVPSVSAGSIESGTAWQGCGRLSSLHSNVPCFSWSFWTTRTGRLLARASNVWMTNLCHQTVHYHYSGGFRVPTVWNTVLRNH